MRRYTLAFMEQRPGSLRLMQIDGAEGAASFTAADDEAALAHIAAQLIERVKRCARADLSSLLMIADPASPEGTRLVDDTHANPNSQDTYVRYHAAAGTVEFDWDSTRTALIADC